MWVVKYNTLETNIFHFPVSLRDKNTKVDNMIKLSPPFSSNFQLYTVDIWEGGKLVSAKRYAVSQIYFQIWRALQNTLLAASPPQQLHLYISRMAQAHIAELVPSSQKQRLHPAYWVETAIHVTPFQCPGIVWGNTKSKYGMIHFLKNQHWQSLNIT